MTMTKEQFNREIAYNTALTIARSLLTKGLINNKDYRKIDTKLKKKYRPIIGTLSL